MPGPSVFIDTNVLLYLLSADTEKADRAEALVRAGGLISVQVLNEMAHVARRKLALSWSEIEEFSTLIRSVCTVVPLTIDIHDRGRWIAERYGLRLYDAMIAAAALLGGCNTLYSEDFQDGLVISQQVTVRNPFRVRLG